MTEPNPQGATNARLSRSLPLDYTDRSPQRMLDRILWQYVHGPDSEPPPPGPNAAGVDARAWRRGAGRREHAEDGARAIGTALRAVARSRGR
jgi:hypothetical protein